MAAGRSAAIAVTTSWIAERPAASSRTGGKAEILFWLSLMLCCTPDC
jgi:hypothetical protein